MEKIDSDLKAYFYGWMLSDGCVCYNKTAYSYSTALKIHKKDESVLDLFTDLANFKISQDGNCVVIKTYNRKFTLDLIALGCLPNKSFENENNLVLPDLSIDLMRYFIRGLFDGDGCYYLRKDKRLDCVICCRNETLLLQLQQYLKINLDIDCEFSFKTNKHRGLWVLRMRKVYEVKKFIDYVFDHSSNLTLVCNRKYKKVKNYLDEFRTKEVAMAQGVVKSSNSNKGKQRTLEQRLKMSENNKGKKHSIEVKAKIKLKMKEKRKWNVEVFNSEKVSLGIFNTLTEIQELSLLNNLFNICPKELTNTSGRNGYPFYYFKGSNMSSAIKTGQPYKTLYFTKRPIKTL